MRYLKYLIIFLLLIGIGNWSHAATRVPHRFHFQSVFYDTGGNPLPSGSYNARFSILDQSDQAVFIEEQQVEIANGVVSVMVGDGFKEGSQLTQPTGGIPPGALDPNQTYYLKIDINGDTQQSPLEIASVPYAFFSEEALSVSPGSILAESLAQGIIEKDHLSQTLQDAIFGSIAPTRLPTSVASKQDLITHITSRMNAHPAEAISTTSSSFANSNATQVAGVLKDLDVAIEFQKHNLNTKVSKTGDTMTGTLQMQGANISLSEGSTVDGYDISSALPNLQGQINQEAQTRSAADDAINNNISQLRAQDANLQTQITGIQQELAAPEGGVAPQVVAMGIVDVLWWGNQSIVNGYQLLSGYNIERVEMLGNVPGGSTQIRFRNPISLPYYVQAVTINTPFQHLVDNNGQGKDGSGFINVIERSDTSLVIDSKTTPFNFVIYR